MGIVRKKRITNKKSKTNLSNEKSNSINNRNSKSKSNSLQNGGSPKGPKPGSVPKAGKIDFSVKRDSSQTMSRPKQALLATGKAAKVTGQAIATLAVAHVAAVASGVRALGTGAYAAGLYGKAAVKSAASVPKLAYQAEKLRQAQRTMNRVTGADVYKSHQNKHAKLIANYQAQTKKYGSLADGGKKLSSLANAFIKNKEKLNTSLEKRVTGTSKWSRFYKPFTPKSNYKMPTNIFASKIKETQSVDPLKPLDFSQIIKDKQAAYNASQTTKKTAEIEKRTENKQAALNAVAKTHSGTQTVLSKVQESRNKLQTKLDEFDKLNPLTMTKDDRAKHFEERNTILKTKQVADKTFKEAQLEHTKSESLLKKAQTALNARKASANKTARKKFSTTENIQSSINRRSARLNTTKKKIGSYFSDATEKVGRDWERTKRVFTRATDFTLGRSAKGKAEYNAKVQAYTVKRDARKAAAEVAKAKEGPGFFSRLKTSITPNMLRGAQKLTKSVEHIGKLDVLKGQMANVDKKLREINPNGINYDFKINELISKGKTDADPEMQTLKADKKRYNKAKIEKTKIEFEVKQRENTLTTVSKELHKRISSPQDKISRTAKFEAMDNIKKAKLPGLFDSNKMLLPIEKLNLDTITNLMKNASSKNKMFTFNLLQNLYKDKKNLDATVKIDSELAKASKSQSHANAQKAVNSITKKLESLKPGTLEHNKLTNQLKKQKAIIAAPENVNATNQTKVTNRYPTKKNNNNEGFSMEKLNIAANAKTVDTSKRQKITEKIEVNAARKEAPDAKKLPAGQKQLNNQKRMETLKASQPKIETGANGKIILPGEKLSNNMKTKSKAANNAVNARAAAAKVQ